MAPRPSLAAIVASLHGRTGKTLLARVLADYFVLAGTRPLLFDTDVTEQTLHAWFPYDTVVVDLTEVRDQMTLFDTLAARSPEARVVDVSHYVFRKFFKVMQDLHFVAEARARRVEPIIFYIADRNPDAYEEGRVLRERFDDCAFVLVENAFVGRIKDVTRRSAGYRAFETHDLCIALPPLDLAIADAIDDPNVSLSDIMSRPLSRSADDASGRPVIRAADRGARLAGAGVSRDPSRDPRGRGARAGDLSGRRADLTAPGTFLPRASSIGTAGREPAPARRHSR